MKHLTRAGIIRTVKENTSLQSEDAATVVESILEEISLELEAGNDVHISRFGKFRVLSKKSRVGRNPRTKEQVSIPARKVVVFNSGQLLRNHINDEEVA